LYSFLSKNEIELEAWYCSDETMKGAVDVQFGKVVEWDIPLLEGYKYRFFNNNSWKPSIFNGFWGVMNFGIIKALFQEKKSIVVVHGWSTFSYLISIIFGKIAGHKVAVRGESPLNQELAKSKKNLFFKKILFKLLLKPFVDYFLYVGKQNKAFYTYFGADEKRLVFTPYAIDNTRFQEDAKLLKANSSKKRKQLQIKENATVFLFSGKYIHKKRPLLLLKVYEKIQNDDTALIMIGEGELRVEMEKFITEKNLKNVILTGFVNQSEITSWYGLADVFVMCSGHGETWGLTVNEAMNFGIPIIESDGVGSAIDLVNDGENGYIFHMDDENDLTNKMITLLNMKKEDKDTMGTKSLDIINNYSFKEILAGFKKITTA
jgi:glycosyltransferase involved in cell wall biosynthesis